MEPIIRTEKLICLLSICIPTYNRASVLEQCLKNITTQKGFDERTEIIILDNNSTDNTEEITNKYVVAFSNISYYRNAENIGMEKNLIKVLQFGNGKLLKLWNDYCLFYDDKLEVILSMIEDNADEKSILYFHNKEGKFEIIICNELNTFFTETTYWPTWIGTFSIWKNDYITLGKQENFEGLLFPHLLIFLTVFKLKSSVVVNYSRLFYEASNIKKGGYDFFEVFVQNFIGKILQKLAEEGKITKKTLHTVKFAFFNNFLKPWVLNILFDKTHTFKSKNYLLVYKYFKFFPELYLLIISLPFRALLNSLKSLKKQKAL